MKVLLIEDVDNLGYAGDVKKVANGFGRNYLLPHKMAVLATPGALKQAETIRKTAEKRRAQLAEDAKAIVNQLEGLVLIFERRAGEMGKLYGSVTSGEIAEAIEAEKEIPIDKRKVALPEPIRSLGIHDVIIKLMIDVTTSIKVEVLPLGGILERSRLTAKEAAEAGIDAEDIEIDTEPDVETSAEAAASIADISDEAEVDQGDDEPHASAPDAIEEAVEESVADEDIEESDDEEETAT